ncbi:hypothetical protein MesoLj113a_57020 [Mesorhizobium sp. 113-1-2]|nr:Programmed cell death protein 2, Pcdc2/rp-8 [Mesorhizobium loti]BCG74544.1 hypothetical protein MesoLj113a_57020 [Mesorhizobium sp. 113-1-2]
MGHGGQFEEHCRTSFDTQIGVAANPIDEMKETILERRQGGIDQPESRHPNPFAKVADGPDQIR